ncbi:MAG: hypothetical protein WKG00_07430, partial [Polyangiaceae bacterium]
MQRFLAPCTVVLALLASSCSGDEAGPGAPSSTAGPGGGGPGAGAGAAGGGGAPAPSTAASGG